MGVTNPTLTGPGTYPIEVDSNRWAVNDFVEDTYPNATAAVKAAPGAGRALYLTHVTIGIADAPGMSTLYDNVVTLRDEDGNVLYGPIQVQSKGSGHIKKDFKHPLKLVDNKALHHYSAGGSASSNGAVLIYVEGFTGDKPLG